MKIFVKTGIFLIFLLLLLLLFQGFTGFGKFGDLLTDLVSFDIDRTCAETYTRAYKVLSLSFSRNSASNYAGFIALFLMYLNYSKGRRECTGGCAMNVSWPGKKFKIFR